MGAGKAALVSIAERGTEFMGKADKSTNGGGNVALLKRTARAGAAGGKEIPD